MGNRDRVAYKKKAYLIEAGLVGISPSDDVLIGIKKIQDKFKAQVVSSSLALEDLHVSFQDDFMRERLMDKDPYSGRAIGGILTDTTYAFFKRGYLTTSSVYSRMLLRWVPVLFTYSETMDSSIFKAHYLALIQTIIQSCDDDRETLIAQV